MNRYQFEDLISSYIENDLPIRKRKEFEEYIENNAEAKIKVDSLRALLKKINNIPRIKTSNSFNQTLQKKISAEPYQTIKKVNNIFGLKPSHAATMTGLAISFIFVTMLIFEPNIFSKQSEDQIYSVTVDQKNKIQNPQTTNIAKNSSDYSEKNENDTIQYQRKDFSKKIHFVND